MKTSKSPEGNEVTPSKKKLKQARLPFKIITEDSPKSLTPPSRKRKLSTPGVESVIKVGKISKENNIVEDPVITIDDDSQDEKCEEKAEKLPNPYVKLVDTAWKKKLQKSKGLKPKKGSKKRTNDQVIENGSAELDSDTADDKKKYNKCEMMEVDDLANEETNTDGAKIDLNKETMEKETVETIQKETELVVNTYTKDVSYIIVLDDSNSNHKTSEKLMENKSDSVEELPQIKLQDVTNIELEKPHESNSNDIAILNEDSSEESPISSDSENDKKGSETEEIVAPTTPKRSARNKEKQEKNNNSKGSPTSSQLNESITSNLSTPKPAQSSSVIKLDESLNESTPLTPKQLQKKLESAKKREEREKEKQDREKKRQQEKEERAKQRQEKEDQKKREREEKEEAKKKEKEEKEEQRRKEKEEKEKIKELEKKQREEKEEQKRKEKEEKEEQKRKEREAREEEKRKKQEALELEKQEQELKKKKTADAFVSFFVPKQKVEKDQPIVGTVSNNMLSSFTLKSDMRLAPTTRTSFSEERANELVKLIKEQSVKEDGLYLRSLKNGASKPLSSGKTWPRNDKDDDDVILVEDELPPTDGAGEIITCESANREKLRPKLLSFHDNRRPPYWGTWRKKSECVRARRPFGQDEKQLDYEADSDDEWEEDQEGESIDGSAAGSDDEQGPDEYEVDNEVFVPHGYLSDEEATMDEDDVLSLSPETQKAKLKYLEDEFESEMKKPTEKLKPRLYGLLWENSDGGKPEKCVDAMWNYFRKLSMILDDPTPLLQPSQETDETENKKAKKKKAPPPVDGEQGSPKAEKRKKTKLQEKEGKPSIQENKKNVQEAKKNQPGINIFLTKLNQPK